MLPLLLLLSPLTLHASHEVSLDLGWRMTPYQAQPCTPFLPLPHICLDMSSPRTDTHSWRVDASTESQCTSAACSARSNVYSFNGTHCYIGDASMLSLNQTQCLSFSTGVRDPSAWPPASPAEASPTLDDSTWATVDLPHDAAASTPHTFPAAGGQGFRLPVAVFYRKHFALLSDWANASLSLSLPGAATSSAWWLNGVPLSPRRDSGYLPLHLPLNASAHALLFGPGAHNILAGWVDNMARTGWWEEGSGLTRGGAALVIGHPSGAALAPSGVAAPAYAVGQVHSRATPGEGVWADAAAFSPSAEVTLAEGGAVTLLWQLLAFNSTTAVLAAVNASATLPAGGGTVAAPPGSLTLPSPAELWSVPRPLLYQLRTQLLLGGGASALLVDQRLDAVGVRDAGWSGDSGLALNTQPVKLRGWCEHASWGGLGAALPARVDLLRLQQLRGLGGNALRTSHNPPTPQLLHLADRLGVLVLDENRVMANVGNVGGEEGSECGAGGCRSLPHYAGDVVQDAGALARRDRLHASVLWYSLCNEFGCGPGTLLSGDILAAKEAIVAADPSRAVTGNLGWQGVNATRPGQPFDDVVDVVGMSHQSAATLGAFHAASPFKPLAMTECCSCQSMRAADSDQPQNATVVLYSNEQSQCLAAQTQVSNAPQFCAGTFVWTLHDYAGEPDAYPHVSSSFGSIDYAGMKKPAAAWFSAWWLGESGASGSDAGRPPLPPSTRYTCRIVEAWGPSPNGTRTIHVYANAAGVRLLLPSGALFAQQPVAAFGAAAVFFSVPYSPGTLTAQALAADGSTVLASHSASSAGPPAALQLTLDAPSLSTGTGRALFLDGSDVALLRVTVVDSEGVQCWGLGSDSPGAGALTVSFAVQSGPAVIVGVHNGHPALQSLSGASSVEVYGGLARGVARVSLLAAGSAAALAEAASVNVDAGRGGGSSSIWGGQGQAPTAVVFVATAPGLPPAVLQVALSVAEEDSPLAVAAASVGSADFAP